MLVSADKPWLRRNDWATGRVNAVEGTGLVIGGLFVLLWYSGMAAIAWFLISRVGERRVEPYLVLGGFTAAGLVPLAMVVREARLRVRYGQSIFEMAPVPASPGGRLQGAVVVSATMADASRVLATLTCWQRSEHRKGVPQVLWENEEMVTPEPRDASARIPVRFDIPSECSSTQLDTRRGGIYWQLRLEGRDGARGFENTFDVPVFTMEPGEAPAPASAPRQPSRSTIVLERPEPRVTRLRFRFGPLGLVFSLILPVLSPLAFFTPISTLWAAIGVVVLVGFGLIAQLTEPMGIDVGPNGITLRRGFRGWFGKRSFAVADVQELRLYDCVNGLKQLRIGTRTREHFDASQVLGVMEARWLAWELRRAIVDAGGRPEEWLTGGDPFPSSS